MDKLALLFEEFVLKAVVQTESALNIDCNSGDQIESFTMNRDRLFMVLDQISKQVNWNNVPIEKKDELNKQIDYIKKLDEKILVKLQEYQLELKKDIEATCRQKENIKGYNLNDVK